MSTADDAFFNAYEKVVAKKAGIPGFQMNAPLVQNTLPGMLGLELELEARNNLPRDGHLETIRSPETRAMWQAVQDGSLRGEGREYIFTAPVKVEEVPYMINSLWDVFAATKVKLDNSNRCSTHVHVNMKGKTINQLTSILCLWATFESQIIRWCGEERQTNHFALSMQDAVSVVKTWERYLRSGSFNGVRDLKYSALNVLPLWEKGSFEFRCGPAADNAEIPIKWTQFLWAFVNYASDRYPNPANIAFDLSERGGSAILREIAQGLTILPELFEGLSDNEADDMALKGFRVVQPIVLGFPWDQWLELINREFVPNPFAAAPKAKKSAGIRPLNVMPGAGNGGRMVFEAGDNGEWNARPVPQEDAPAIAEADIWREQAQRAVELERQLRNERARARRVAGIGEI